MFSSNMPGNREGKAQTQRRGKGKANASPESQRRNLNGGRRHGLMHVYLDGTGNRSQQTSLDKNKKKNERKDEGTAQIAR
jgi:hypothetical protein